MAMATHTLITRRTLAATLAAVIPAAAVAGPPAAAIAAGTAIVPAEPDPLHDLFARWRRKRVEVNGSKGHTDEELDALIDVQCDIEREIFAHPTETVEGLALKA